MMKDFGMATEIGNLRVERVVKSIAKLVNRLPRTGLVRILRQALRRMEIECGRWSTDDELIREQIASALDLPFVLAGSEILDIHEFSRSRIHLRPRWIVRRDFGRHRPTSKAQAAKLAELGYDGQLPTNRWDAYKEIQRLLAREDA